MDDCECAPCPEIDARGLSNLSADELEEVFHSGVVNGIPLGYAKGRPLLMLDYRRPRLRASMSGMVWKGKHFLPDGRMINQWVGFRAVGADVWIEASMFDGQPCIHIEYPPNAAVFGNSFDELREIAPSVFLGRFCERCPTPRLKGYFVLTMCSR